MTQQHKHTPMANDLLRQARWESGWTQRSLARELEVAEQTVRSWERGTRSPSLEVRKRLCELLAKTPEQLGLQRIEQQELLSQESPEPLSPPPRTWANTNRSRMLKRVHTLWIAGVLQRSLYLDTLITLELWEQPDATQNPWQQAVQEANSPAHLLPAGTRILQVYDDADGELLILGEPGAGKTTLLLELTRDLLNRAELDETHPIPVVFNVSSWMENHHTFIEWLIEELNTKYQVPHELGQEWLANDHILILLDGLDEIAETHRRRACIEALNSYRQERGFVPMVVCSRSEDYFAQEARLRLHTAVKVQPLTEQQIGVYIAQVGKPLAALSMALHQDMVLREMASSPLMLHILAVTYDGMSVEEVCSGTPTIIQRQAIFRRYVERLLHRGSQPHYPMQQMKEWLTHLARQLTQHSQTEFYVERMQPDWLSENRSSRQRYVRAIVRFVFGFQILIVAGLFAWLRGGKQGNIVGVGMGLLGLLGSGPGNTILGWMAPGLGGGLEGGGSLGIIIMLVMVLVNLLVGSPLTTISMRAIWHGLIEGMRKGLMIGGMIGVFSALIFSRNGGLANGLDRGLGLGLFSSLLIGLLTGLLVTLRYERLCLEGYPLTHKRQMVRLLDHLFDFLCFGLCAGLSFGGVYAWLVGQVTQNVLIYGTVIGMFAGITFSIGGGTNLMPGLGITIRPAESAAWSWRNAWRSLGRSLRHGLLLGLVVSVVVIVVIGAASTLFYGAGYGFRYGLVYGPITGLVGGVASTLAGILNSGWTSTVLSDEQLLRPNQGIRRSLWNSIFAACLFGPIGGIASGLVCGLAFGLLGGLAGWPILAVGFALVFFVIFALQFALRHGGIAVIEHYVLRWYLWRAGFLPWNYIAFLDDAAEHILLRKVGGGYIFSHRLLRDYFATLETKAEPRKQPRSSS